MGFLLHFPSTQLNSTKMHPLAFIGQTKRFDPMSTLGGALLIRGNLIYPLTDPAAIPSTIRSLMMRNTSKMGKMLIINVAPIAPQSVVY
ncbi:hypothetical protein PPSQR21_036980 [Paenibacillus polymyxa SQR-21]|nr:hypothetical protein PPSQR21_036980 [Paenibacillus polymyxa SQR-21]